MVTITERADRVLKRKVFRGREISPIRIFRKNGGCCHQALAVGFDEPKDSDVVIRANEFTFIMDQTLLDATQDVTLDYQAVGPHTGFRAIPKSPLSATGCGSCRC
jgi:Fe-S cluster assembly iron-binding protein IscA